uniref:Uncharacterized protein n=1 Tax=Trypanosoma congolense (strain IL3000) TaxID=1068625 RepID=G0UYU4_TRYCI|nr:conserved hypothetical protein [Trypanosoma congolense IL3000]
MTSKLNLWIVAHEGSGQGKGRKAVKYVEKELRDSFNGIIIRKKTASEALAQCTEAIGHQCSTTSDTRPVENCATGASRHTSSVFVRPGSVCADIITTDDNSRVERLVEELTNYALSKLLLGICWLGDVASAATDPNEGEATCASVDAINVFVIIGGDGSLGEAVNGLCFGTIKAYRNKFNKVNKSVTSADDCEDSLRYFRRTLEDRAVLRHLLPLVMYVPAGTGSDFARTKMCCIGGEEFSNTLKGLCEYLGLLYNENEPLNSETGSVHTKHKERFGCLGGCGEEHGSRATKLLMPGFALCNIDISRITFPRTGRVRFFINECSCGLSCDVISRCERYKRSRLAQFLGGPLLFAVASAISITRARQRQVRVVVLPDAPPPPPTADCNGQSPAVNILYRQHISKDAAFEGLNLELQWLDTCSEANTVLPTADPLWNGADYYVYDYNERKEHWCTSGAADFRARGSACSSEEEQGVATNPFYTRWRRQSVSNKAELLSSVAGSDASGRWISFPSSTLVFGNGRWFGGGIQVTPHANPTDGTLSVTNWVTNFCRFVTGATSLYNGNHGCWSNTTMWNLTRCIVDADGGSNDRCGTPTTVSSCSNESTCGSCENEGERPCGEKVALDEILTWCEADGELCEPLPAIVEVSAVVGMIIPLRRTL